MSRRESLLRRLPELVRAELREDELPIRFVITHTTPRELHCELGVMRGDHPHVSVPEDAIFSFRQRTAEQTDRFTAVVVIPTGVGAALGGHAGDANAMIRLFAAGCDRLVTHPNTVNASDINEMPDNCLYVEGSVLARFLMGTIGLQPVRANRVIAVLEEHPGDPMFTNGAINSVSAARATLGLTCPRIIVLKEGWTMKGEFAPSGRAVGRVEGFERLLTVLRQYREECDAFALASVVAIPNEVFNAYLEQGGVNPMGGVEAMLTHATSLVTNLPTAHAPMTDTVEAAMADFGVADPRLAAEAVSMTFFHSVLKGLARSPRIIPIERTPHVRNALTAADVSCLVIPDGCLGLPTLAALEQGIPVIAVTGNTNEMRNDLAQYPFQPGRLFLVKDYCEAFGVMGALRAGIDPAAVARPLAKTPTFYTDGTVRPELLSEKYRLPD